MSLLQPFTKEDVRIALFNIDRTKTPGSDGFGRGFFQDMWLFIGDEFSQVVLQFFDTCQLPLQMHHTLITLVPKVDQARTLKDFRPIACCQMIYKVISKMLCHRLAKVLPGIIGEQQGVFMQGRAISHNVLIGQDLLKGYNRTRLSPRLMKIYLQKAYDTIDWSFRLQLLEAYHFPALFITWLKECVCKIRYSLIINGEHVGYIAGKKACVKGIHCPHCCLSS